MRHTPALSAFLRRLKALLGTGLAALLCAGTARAAPVEELVFVAPMNHVMPLAGFSGGQLTQGILKDLGEAVAQRLGLRARFVAQPGKRVGPTLMQGQADAVCYVQPHWIEGSFDWSGTVISNAGVVAARDDVPALHSLEALAGVTVGTVLGYQYPQVHQLGPRFKREDAPSMELNLRKLVVGRVRYAITEQATLAYFQRHEPAAKLKTALQMPTYSTQCAFSKQSKVPFADASKAITALLADGSVERILAKYR